jgi:hypothetical protein
LSIFVQLFVIYLIFSPMFIFIGAAALEYHVAKFHPSNEAIKIFLSNLRRPLSEIYNGTRYKFFTTQKMNSLEYLQTASFLRSLLSVVVYSIIPIVVITAFGKGVLDS